MGKLGVWLSRGIAKLNHLQTISLLIKYHPIPFPLQTEASGRGVYEEAALEGEHCAGYRQGGLPDKEGDIATEVPHYAGDR